MKLTKNILQGFCEDYNWILHICSTSKFRFYSALRLYFPGCDLSPNYLYTTDNSVPVSERDKALADICLITDEDVGSNSDGFACIITADCGLLTVFSAIQTRHEQLIEWDRALSNLLLNGGTIQDILNCSAPVLRNPCIFEDEQFRVIASYGTATQEESSLFYETLKTGVAPVHLFEGILSLSPQARAPYTTTNTVIVVQHFSPYDELLANCVAGGAIVLRFFMLCLNTSSTGVRDIVSHLVSRIESSPGIRQYSGWSVGSVDSLFSRIIDTPSSSDIPAAIDTLGLDSFNLFSVISINFGMQTAEASSFLTKLRMVFPNLRFFVYNNTPFALLGANSKTISSPNSLEPLEKLLFAQLDHMGAVYGVSLGFSDILNLKVACEQAKCAMGTLQQAHYRNYFPHDNRPHLARYEEIQPLHILDSFFQTHDFSLYCPRFFCDLLSDDEKTGSDNLHLLFTYLTNNCNATTASRILHMHRNNVIYRINKIQEKYRMNLDDSKDRLLLTMLCLAAKHKCDRPFNLSSDSL